MSVEVKICGLMRPEDVDAVNAAGADYAGFVFYESSKRCVSFETAEKLLKNLNFDIRSVAVCVSPDAELLRKLEELGFDIIQIHGDIDESALDSIATPVWQAVNLTDAEQLKKISDHPMICGYLIDAAEYGSGKTFGWEYADEIRKAVGGNTFILAGGLDAGNVHMAIELFSPDVVDVSTGVEGSEGKDRMKIFQFVNEVRES